MNKQKRFNYVMLSTVIIALTICFSAFTATPTLIVNWHGGNKETEQQISDNHIKEWATFKIFDRAFFDANKLPKIQIPYRYDINKAVDSAKLEILLEELVAEIKLGKFELTNFIILKKSEFNTKLGAGHLVVKFKDYPFVVKLFVENPYSFVRPFSKGIQSYMMFKCGGGMNRHIAGFTRIKNLVYVNKKIIDNPEWAALVEAPRKWFWEPKENSDLEITGINIDSESSCAMIMPGTYCIIADAIEAEQENLSMFNARDRLIMQEKYEITLRLCDYLDICIDVNPENFLIERDTKKIVIIDTEHYPSLLGLVNKPGQIKNYSRLARIVIVTMLKNAFFSSNMKSGTPFDMQV